jgi:P4 family phage/plasmid primase-like protien
MTSSSVARLPPRFVRVDGKIPVNDFGVPIDPHNPVNWRPRELCGDRVAFVLNGDGYFFLDMDSCGVGGVWSPQALAIHAMFPGAACEVSTSGNGLHVLGRCDVAAFADRKNRWDGWLEFYTTGHCMTFGPWGWQGDPEIDHAAALLRLVPLRPILPSLTLGAGTSPVSDDQVLERMLKARGAGAVFGGGATTDDLWHARADVLGRSYPTSTPGQAFDRSAADAALMAHLAFWCIKDPAQMDRLFRRSALMRPKWEREDYRTSTLAGGLAVTTRTADWSTPAERAAVVAETGLIPLGVDPDMTHVNLAQAFATHAAGRVRFDHSSGKWFAWDGSIWRRGSLVESSAKHAAASMLDEVARSFAITGAQKRSMLSGNAIKSVLDLAKANPAIRASHEMWDCAPHLIGTPAGTVDLKTGMMRPSDPADGISRSTLVAPGGDCPTWTAYVHHIAGGDPTVSRFLQQWAGYSLTGETIEQALLYICGVGGSGKSTFVEMLGEIAADYAVNIPIDTLLKRRHDAHSTELARLAGPHLAYGSETTEGRTWDDGTVKRLTGGDAITARFMARDAFTFSPKFTLTIVGNSIPSFTNVDDAIRRRFNVLNVEQPIPRPDSRFREKLRAEASGILAWIIEGAVDWYRCGALSRPHRLMIDTADYLDGEDTFGQWIAEHCDVGAEFSDTAATLYASYQGFMVSHGLMNDLSSNRGFPNRLKSRGFKAYRTEKWRGWMGIRVRTVRG